MDAHLDELECIIPYLKRGKPICSSPVTMKESRYDLDTIRKKFNPCQEMINVEIGYIDMVQDYNVSDEGPLILHIQYPDQMKIITQARSVDLHALIGNIGGYIGLFLGTSMNDYVFSIMIIVDDFEHILTLTRSNILFRLCCHSIAGNNIFYV